MLPKKLMLYALLMVIGVGLALIAGCSELNKSIDSDQPVSPNIELGEEIPNCNDYPETLPHGILVEDVKKYFDAKTDVGIELLIPEVLEALGGSYSPVEYYIDSSGLHWGHPKSVADPATLGGCYHPYGFSIVGSFHFVYWFSYRPPSYDAYMAWIPIYAEPYGANGILVQKRDICWICGCNPVCVLIWTWICAK